MSKSESKPREFWLNIYDNTHRVWDCVGHSSLEKCAEEMAIYAKEQCVHVIEYSAFERLKSENEKLRKALENSLSTMEAVIEVNEDWSLAQERIGNKGICIPAIRKAREALAAAAVKVQWRPKASELTDEDMAELAELDAVKGDG